MEVCREKTPGVAVDHVFHSEAKYIDGIIHGSTQHPLRTASGLKCLCSWDWRNTVIRFPSLTPNSRRLQLASFCSVQFCRTQLETVRSVYSTVETVRSFFPVACQSQQSSAYSRRSTASARWIINLTETLRAPEYDHSILPK